MGKRKRIELTNSEIRLLLEALEPASTTDLRMAALYDRLQALQSRRLT